MPAPDPYAIEISEWDDGTFTVTAERWLHTNRKARLDRLKAIARNVRRDGWRCHWCGDKIPVTRRADARYCFEGCRKKAARARRRHGLAAL